MIQHGVYAIKSERQTPFKFRGQCWPCENRFTSIRLAFEQTIYLIIPLRMQNKAFGVQPYRIKKLPQGTLLRIKYLEAQCIYQRVAWELKKISEFLSSCTIISRSQLKWMGILLISILGATASRLYSTDIGMNLTFHWQNLPKHEPGFRNITSSLSKYSVDLRQKATLPFNITYSESALQLSSQIMSLLLYLARFILWHMKQIADIFWNLLMGYTCTKFKTTCIIILTRVSRSAMVLFSGAVAKTQNMNFTSFYFTLSNDSFARVQLEKSSSISDLLSIIEFLIPNLLLASYYKYQYYQG